jgi:hypothetical protein
MSIATCTYNVKLLRLIIGGFQTSKNPTWGIILFLRFIMKHILSHKPDI